MIRAIVAAGSLFGPADFCGQDLPDAEACDEITFGIQLRIPKNIAPGWSDPSECPRPPKNNPFGEEFEWRYYEGKWGWVRKGVKLPPQPVER